MIELRHLSITSGAFHLRDISLTLNQGEYVALMGRTGQGKTTIVEAIAGLRTVTSGQIIIEGVDVTRLPPASRGVGYVPQDLALFPTMTVRENLEFALRIRRAPNEARTQALADWLGLKALLDRAVTGLSGGEAQRTALGRALAFEPKVLLLDEPFSALDDETRSEMHRLMARVREKTGVTVLHITHNRNEALALADRVLVIEGGEVGISDFGFRNEKAKGGRPLRAFSAWACISGMITAHPSLNNDRRPRPSRIRNPKSAMPLPLTSEERQRYEWQLWTPGFGEEGQQKLKAATVLISRCGGVGGTVALELAAAGVGRLVLAHGGDLRLNDLNRQLLMTTDHVGRRRVDSAMVRLRELNPNVAVVGVPENISEANVAGLVAQADVIVSAAPLFEERLLMNREALRQGKPLIECAMYDLEAVIMPVVPGQTACLGCLIPVPPTWWKREFPVFGAVAGTAGCMAAMEVIKLIAGFGESLAGHMIAIDFRTMHMRKVAVARDPACGLCGGGGMTNDE